MARIETSISEKYLASTNSREGWGVWEGIRELVQNGYDSEVEHSAVLDIDVHNGTLRIENDGVTLAREALLLGTSSKSERSDTIGKFGEGLKLGILALVRAGFPVKIRTGSEVWEAAIERSEKYDANVLCFHITGGREFRNRIRVEVGNVGEEGWNAVKDRFLFLLKLNDEDAVKTHRGTLLLHERFKGCLYVKGIFVQKDHRLNYGYNFSNASVDRDRRMVSSWDSQWESSAIWRDAVASRPDLFGAFFGLIQNDSSDVSGMIHHAENTDRSIREKIVSEFTTRFGSDAIPVSTLAESAEIGHLGKRGIIVSKPLEALLTSIMGDKSTIQKNLREEVVRTLSWFEMTEEQRKNLMDNIGLVNSVRSDCKLDIVDVVEFRSETLLGQYKNGRMLIAARLLDDRDEMLATIIHEFAHCIGGDGEKSHIMEIENIWRDVVSILRNKKA